MKPATEFVCREAKPVRAGRSVFDLTILTGFCAFLFFFGAGKIGLLGADEPRYAQIAREMLARHDWVTPMLHGQPWLEKPVLYYWQAMCSYLVFGVSDWSARLPSAFDASAMIAAVYFFMRRCARNISRFPSPVSGDQGSALETGNRKLETGTALDAALITASCALVLGFAHAASTDMPLAASFTIGMLAWIAWWQDSKRVSSSRFPVSRAEP